MNNYLIYLFEASVCIAVFYFLYWSSLRHTTFFVLNRLFLVSTVVLSFVVPLLHVSGTGISNPISEYAVSVYDADHVSPDTHGEGILLEQASALPTFDRIVAVIYIVVAAFLALRLIRNVVLLLRERRGSFEKVGDVRIKSTHMPHPFSFLDTIFLPAGAVRQSILDHERVHIEQRHWIDLMIVELSMVVLWFNPVLILVRRSIRLQHEYHADNVAAGETSSPENYLSCLLEQIRPIPMPGPASQFFSNNLKQRIIMLTKEKSPRKMFLLYAMVLPVLAFLLTAFGLDDDHTLQPASRAITLVVDAAHGGTDAGASFAGVDEKTITLAVARQVQAMGGDLNVNVVLTRDNDRTMSLADRTNFAKLHNADVFVSIHMDVDASDPAKHGISCMIAATDARGESRRLSENLRKRLGELAGISFQGTKQGNAYILKNNTVPAAVIELGFLSNSDDLNFVKDVDNQRKIAGQILKSVVDFRNK